jgi:hypothetical protein
MCRRLFRVAGLCLAPLMTLALAHAEKPQPPALKKTEATCGSHGTSVEFVDTPSEAAKIAKKEQKLVFVLHVSGNFEDPRFT